MIGKITLLLFVLTLTAMSKDLILQNGKNGYNGCEDGVIFVDIAGGGTKPTFSEGSSILKMNTHC